MTLEVRFRLGDATGRIEWRVTDARGAWGEVVAVEHPDPELQRLVSNALHGNPLGVRVHGRGALDVGRDAVAVVGALEIIAEGRPGFTFEIPPDWPYPEPPEGAVW